MKFLEKKFNIKRGMSLLIIYGSVICLIVFAWFFIVPTIKSNIDDIYTSLPDAIEQLQKFLNDVLSRIAYERNFYLGTALAKSFMISADNAHATHPNHGEKADATNRPYMNEGIVIKYNANQSYTSDALSSAVFSEILKANDVPFQYFTNRSDMRGGSTLGNISNAQVSMVALDIGLPQLAMHSCFETAGVKDAEYMVKGLKAFYQTDLKLPR
jgi:aspartyl aminopeptidase